MTNRPNYGFTLLEILLAVMIFSMMSLAIYAVLNTTMESNFFIKRKVQNLIQIHRAINLLERDISHAIIYDHSLNYNLYQEGIITGIGVIESDEFGIYMIRNNKVNINTFIDYKLEKLGYRLKNNCLERLSYPMYEAIEHKETKGSCIVDNVNSFKIRALYQSRWLNEWSKTNSLPQCIEVVIDIENIGVIRRLIQLLN